MRDQVAFDPTSSSSTTASSMILVALCCVIGASYSLGKYANDKKQTGFKIGMFVVASGIFLFMGGIYVWFAYD